MFETLPSGGKPLSAKVMEEHTNKDQVLARVKGMILLGKWDSKGSKQADMEQYLGRKLECILWGSRVVVPTKLRPEVLQTLREAHPGVVRMKALAQGTVWWPGVDKDIEDKVKACARCQVNRKTPLPVPWEFPVQAWSRLHVDFTNLFQGKLFIILVDTHSKWLEVAVVSSCSSLCAIRFLRNVFATHGIPEQLVSDNGSAFTSSEFKKFVNRNAIRHTTSALYHPASNGLAERAVQTFTSALIKFGGDVETSLAHFLFTYRLTPHVTMGLTPAEMLLGRKPRSQLGSIRPRSGTAIPDKVKTSQARQKANHDARVKDRSFGLNDPVYSKDVGSKQEWIPGVIRKFMGPVSCD
eukprot:Em0014g521a